MPRPKKIGGPEPKTRSRNGCWPCKAKKVKCGEEKPSCLNCTRQGEACDYSIRLNWDGRTKRKADGGSPEPASPIQASHASCLPGATSLTIKFAGPPAQTSPPKLGSTDAGKQSNATASQSEDQDRNHELLPWQHSNLSGTTTQLTSNSLFRSYQPSVIATPATEIKVIDPALADAGKPPTSDSGSPHAPNGAALHGDLADNRQAGSYMTRGGRSSTDGPPRLKDPSDSIIYPSPTVSNCVSPGLNGRPTSNHNSTAQSASTACMLPPHDVPLSNPHIISRKDHVYTLSPDNRAKRITLNPILVSANPAEKSDLHAYDTSSADNGYGARSRIVTPLPPYSPYNSNIGTPLTPASSYVASEDANQHITVGPSPTAPRESLDLRRLSVNSLLSGPPEKDGSRTATHAEQLSSFSFYPVRDVGTATVTYGLDRGFPDLDVSKNNDTNAINDMSPAMINDEKEMMLQHRFGDGYYVPTEFGF
ncbi:MAG: hypothetical protein M1830_006743, partial [Pleopsidium flavum]